MQEISFKFKYLWIKTIEKNSKNNIQYWLLFMFLRA